MDSSTRDSLAKAYLPNPPKPTFDEVKHLLSKAAGFKLEAIHLNNRVDSLNDQADVLYTAATFLRSVADRDKNLIDQAFDRATLAFEHWRELPNDPSIPDSHLGAEYSRFRTEVRENRATLEDVNTFIEEVQSARARDRRSFSDSSDSSDSEDTESPFYNTSTNTNTNTNRRLQSTSPPSRRRRRDVYPDDDASRIKRKRRLN